MRTLQSFLLFLTLGGVTAGCWGPVLRPPESLRLQETHISPEGWSGRALLRDDVIVLTELDSDGDGRLDRFRHYRNGALVRERYDLNADDHIDIETNWSGDGANILRAERFELRNTSPVERWCRRGRSAWQRDADRNGDGKMDDIFIFRAGADLFAHLRLDPARLPPVREAIPRGSWHSQILDRDFDGVFEVELDLRERASPPKPPAPASASRLSDEDAAPAEADDAIEWDADELRHLADENGAY